jgi:uncharacterized protein YbjT (DUF2867 family)
MRLLILGASGGVGTWFTRLASQRGHAVTPVARASAEWKVPGVTVERGDVNDAAFINEIVRGHDAVVSCLGLRRASKIPYARLLSPPDLTERVTRLVLAAMRAAGVGRIIAVSAGGVGDSFSRLSWLVQRTIIVGNVAVAYRDLDNMERALEQSGLDWLAPRPVTLVDGAPTGRARPVEKFGLFSIIRRSDVAAWMLDAVESPEPFREHRVLLGY